MHLTIVVLVARDSISRRSWSACAWIERSIRPPAGRVVPATGLGGPVAAAAATPLIGRPHRWSEHRKVYVSLVERLLAGA